MRSIIACVFCLGFLLLFSCNEPEKPKEPVSETPVTPRIEYEVVKIFPHDTNLFTEGLLVYNGQLFESSGAPEDAPQTHSVIGVNDLSTGKFTKKAEIDRIKYFGEGISILNGKVFQLTYKNQQGFIYDATTFRQLGTFPFRNKEGWSLTTDGHNLIMSDGTDELSFLEPEHQKEIKTLKVTENGMPLNQINELEYIKGFIYANVWTTNAIIKIDPATGHVLGRMDLSSLVSEARNKNPGIDVLNGIAYDADSDKVYVTGKLWPYVYQIKFPH